MEPTKNCETDLQREVAKKWQPKKARSVKLADIYQRCGGLDARAGRVRQCADTVTWRLDDAGAHLHQVYFCKDRLCPLCAWRRSLKVFSQVSKVMDYLARQGPPMRYIFLTLTVRSVSADNLKDAVTGLLDGWRKLYHDIRRGRRTIQGAIRALEVTRNAETELYHPHIHVVMAVQPSYFGQGYITQHAWARMWADACGLDYDPVVDVRAVKAKPGRHRAVTGGLAAAVAEISKYTVKDGDYLGHEALPGDEVDIVLALLSALGTRRLVDFLGVFRKARAELQLDDPEQGDLIHLDGDDMRDDISYCLITYGWKCGIYVRDNS